MTPLSAAKKRANEKWIKANYKRLNVAMPIDEYQALTDYCNRKKCSKNGFLREAMAEKMERDK